MIIIKANQDKSVCIELIEHYAVKNGFVYFVCYTQRYCLLRDQTQVLFQLRLCIPVWQNQQCQERTLTVL